MTDLTSIQSLLYQVRKPLTFLADCAGAPFRAVSQEEFVQCKNHPTDNPDTINAFVPALPPENLGDPVFKKRHDLAYAYVGGAMANGITSARMVLEMAQNGMMAFFGAGGLSIDRIEKNVVDIRDRARNMPFGFNLIHSLADFDHEMATVDLYLRYGVRRISAAAFMQMTLPLVWYRLKGIHQGPDGRINVPNHVVAKVSRIEVARQFFSPPPEKLVARLLEKRLITPEEARLSQKIPMAWDLTVEADSGGHTDNRPALTLLPTMLALKFELESKYDYDQPLCVGLAGGIATPESAAAAFQMGAAYILTGSINQACIEADISSDVKQMLAVAEQPDVAMAPSADMFEIGARVQVLKRGTMFPVRAEKLYRVYRSYDRFDDVPEQLKHEIEEKILQSGFDAQWEQTRRYFEERNQPKEIQRALENPKHKMALVFRSYLGQSSRWAIEGTAGRKMDYQVWSGPAIGAFNQWVKSSFLEPVENRRVVEVAMNILMGASVCMRRSFLVCQTMDQVAARARFVPTPMDKMDLDMSLHM